MITEKKSMQLVQIALDYCQGKVDGAEVTVGSSDLATARFAANSMTQNQNQEKTGISVRVIKDGKQTRLSTDQLSKSAIHQLVDRALIALSFLKEDEKLLPLATGSDARGMKKIDRYDLGTARLSPMKRAEAVKEIIRVAEKYDVTAAGVVASGCYSVALGNSNGIRAYHKETTAECSITMKAPDSTGWSKSQQLKFTALNFTELAENAARKAALSANPRDIAPGRYTVILEHSAVLDMLGFLWGDFSATSHLDKLSCFLDKVGTQVLGKNISIEDDVYHPLQAGAPFDGEGLARQKVELVKFGVVENLVYGRRAASTCCAQHTGHGVAQPSSMGEYAVNICVAGGEQSVEDLIKGTKKGILLTRVWYVREVDPAIKVVTGMTRDGTFLVEDGVITGGIKNLRFNQSIIELLNNVVALGIAKRTAGEESFPAVVPAMKVDNFNFTSVTTF